MVEGLPSPPREYTHYYVSFEEEFAIPTNEKSIAEPSTTPPLSQFLRVPEIHVPTSLKIRSELLINYSQSQILTSTNHIEKLHSI